MKAYIIDPTAAPWPEQQFREVDYNDDYRTIYDHLSFEGRKVTTFDCVGISGCGTTLYVDDEGMLHDPSYFFRDDLTGIMYAGKALVLGTDDEGESVEPDCDLDFLKWRFTCLERMLVL